MTIKIVDFPIEHGDSYGFPYGSYGFPMVFLWFSYGFSYGFPVVFHSYVKLLEGNLRCWATHLPTPLPAAEDTTSGQPHRAAQQQLQCIDGLAARA